MLYSWIYEHFGWLGLPGLSAVVGLAIWGGLVHLSYQYYFVWHRDRYVPDYQESAATRREAMQWSLLNLAGNTGIHGFVIKGGGLGALDLRTWAIMR